MYGIATVLSQMTSLILLPVYTRALTPEDYGVLELMQLVVDFTALFVSMRLGEAIFRYYTGSDSPEVGNETVASCLGLAMMMGALGLVAIAMCSGWLAESLFGDRALRGLLLLMGTTLLLQPLIELPAALIRAQQRPKVFLAFRLAGLALRVALNVVFVVGMKMGVAGAVYANVLATATQAVVMGGYAVAQVGCRFRWERARAVFGFSWPILVGSLGSYYIGFADRYFLRMFSDLETIGLYALAARFGTAYFAFGYTPFSMAWDAERYRIAKSANPIPAFQQVFRMLSVYLVFLGLVVSVLADDVIRILAAEPFWGAAQLIPIFIANALFMAWGAYVRFGLLLRERTIEFARVTWMAVPITTLAFIVLIPGMHATGAVLAVTVGNLFRLIYVHFKARAVYDMRLEWSRIAPATIVLMLVVVILPLVPVSSAISAAALDAIVLILGALFLWCGPVLSSEDRRRVIGVGKFALSRLPVLSARRV